MKPILFNAEMVRAILEDRKTVTRRVVKFPKGRNPAWSGYMPDGTVLYGSNNIPAVKSPYHPGDILYVRETWGCYERYWFEAGYFLYRADYPDGTTSYDATGITCDLPIWRPSIHMPETAARLFLRVKNVRAERLQDITVGDVLLEGAPDEIPPTVCQEYYFPPLEVFLSWSELQREEWYKSTARARYIGWCDYADKLLKKFGGIWDSTIKPSDRDKYGWKANPWVWVIEFERVSREEALKI